VRPSRVGLCHKGDKPWCETVAFSLRQGYLTATVYPGCIRLQGHLYASLRTRGLDTQRYMDPADLPDPVAAM